MADCQIGVVSQNERWFFDKLQSFWVKSRCFLLTDGAYILKLFTDQRIQEKLNSMVTQAIIRDVKFAEVVVEDEGVGNDLRAL